jgi:cytoskeletal protein RodZ
MDFEILVTLTAIVFGSLTIIAVFAMITGLLRYWIRERHQGSKVISDEAFLIALKEFKEKTDRRLAALESLIAAPTSEQESQAASEQASQSTLQDEGDGGSKRLKNMLS